jgi:hypothetical protein
MAKWTLKEQVKVGRRLYGAFYQHADGREIYLAFRDFENRNQGPYCWGRTLGDALRDGVASWAMDHDTLNALKVRGVKIVGVRIAEGLYYLTYLDRYLDSKLSKYKDDRKRGETLQRCLPIQYFRTNHDPHKRASITAKRIFGR